LKKKINKNRQRGENRTQKECIEVEQGKLYQEIGLIEKG
jgi:hypothetical protein